MLIIMLNFNPTKAQIELQKKARSFAINHVLPEAWHYDIKDETPVHILKGAFTQGLSHGDIPATYGGKGFGIIEGCVISEEIAASCQRCSWQAGSLLREAPVHILWGL
eukprot:TRINITY_DN31118_c0_g1_i1.p4 TRINITY_DN31118_c0_g1~~TRINITY_DN31118_c0_g1_i1.p4  ORF type:complete len:108 (+),score=12.78 TRINITY_DN31118_c0_g1_i1:586-909(+)